MGKEPHARPLIRRHAVIGVVASSIAIAAPAAAQDAPRDPVQAESLFRSGVDLLQKDDWAGACPRFDESMRLDPSLGAQINIARCREHEGKLASAWAAFRAASDLNRRPDGTFRDDQAQSFVSERIAALEPRLPRLVVTVTPAAQGLTMTRDGRPFGLAGLADPQPVDAGTHVVEASAPGFRSTKGEATAIEGKTVEIKLVLEPAPEEAGPVAPPPKPPTTPPKKEAPSGLGVRGFIGIGLASAGGAALVVAAITGGLAASNQSDLEALDEANHCRVDESGDQKVRLCDPRYVGEARDYTDGGRTLATASTLTLFLGAASATVGLLLILTDSGARDEAGAVTLTLGPAHATLGGTF